MLKQELTSVQCGECLDIFDVQLPSLGQAPQITLSEQCMPAEQNNSSVMSATPGGESAPMAPMNGMQQQQQMEEQPMLKQRRLNDQAPVSMQGGGPDMGMAAAPPPVEDESTSNLESSLQSCMAHRERILQMLLDDPDNTNLIELRDQLTNAINQLQGTKSMVQRAQSSRGSQGAVGPDGQRLKSHSSRKNKPQRCSVCGGIGHKSRTCSMAVQQQHPGGQQQMHQVQWATQNPGLQTYMPPYGAPQMYAPNAQGGPAQMYAGNPQGGNCGGYMMAPGQPGQMAANFGPRQAGAVPQQMAMSGQPNAQCVPGGAMQLNAMAAPTDSSECGAHGMCAGNMCARRARSLHSSSPCCTRCASPRSL